MRTEIRQPARVTVRAGSRRGGASGEQKEYRACPSFRRAGLWLQAATLSLVVATAVSAVAADSTGGPVTDRYTFEESRIFEDPCGFPIEAHTRAGVRTSDDFDEQGLLTGARTLSATGSPGPTWAPG
jgi:hypothetical protein